MRNYIQKVRFYRTFEIEAKDAEEATHKLQDLVDEVTFQSDVESEGVYLFEDEPEECPTCHGAGEVGDVAGDECPTCKGSGTVDP